MTVKLSSTKVARLLSMNIMGSTQLAIAEHLNVNQATVSLYVNEFSAAVTLNGLEAAAEEYGIMDVVK
ncbi:MAG TPA: hypothetical protein VEH58_06215, partial [Dehalococcoidales bacterium]|nr:hypothetical protein [Dehalococcoidales bacterium]